MEDIKSLYESLKDSGQLLEMFPQSKGDWGKDKKFFTIFYEDNQKIINDDISIDDDEEEEFYNPDNF